MKPALTLVELVVAITLIMLISVPSVLGVQRIKSNYALRSSTDDLIVALNRAHIFAREAKGNEAWGIKYVDGSTYELVSGNSAAPIVAATYSLEAPAAFSSPAGWDEIWFGQGSGIVDQAQMIIVTTNNGSQTIVDVSQTGLIEEVP